MLLPAPRSRTAPSHAKGNLPKTNNPTLRVGQAGDWEQGSLWLLLQGVRSVEEDTQRSGLLTRRPTVLRRGRLLQDVGGVHLVDGGGLTEGAVGAQRLARVVPLILRHDPPRKGAGGHVGFAPVAGNSLGRNLRVLVNFSKSGCGRGVSSLQKGLGPSSTLLVSQIQHLSIRVFDPPSLEILPVLNSQARRSVSGSFEIVGIREIHPPSRARHELKMALSPAAFVVEFCTASTFKLVSARQEPPGKAVLGL